MRKLDTKTETEVVAYIARGDNYDDIITLLGTKGIKLAKSTITNIKDRNAEALKFMQDTMVEQSVTQATSILRKSRQLIENKLDRALELDEMQEAASILYRDGDIEYDQYREIIERINYDVLSISELNSVTKESFNQSQVEQGKPSSIVDNPTQAKASLAKVLRAIAAGDEEAALDALFLHD